MKRRENMEKYGQLMSEKGRRGEKPIEKGGGGGGRERENETK